MVCVMVCAMVCVMVCTSHKMLLGWSDQGERDRRVWDFVNSLSSTLLLFPLVWPFVTGDITALWDHTACTLASTALLLLSTSLSALWKSVCPSVSAQCNQKLHPTFVIAIFHICWSPDHADWGPTLWLPTCWYSGFESHQGTDTCPLCELYKYIFR
jgi:hypothetical protein